MTDMTSELIKLQAVQQPVSSQKQSSAAVEGESFSEKLEKAKNEAIDCLH